MTQKKKEKKDYSGKKGERKWIILNRIENK